MLGPFSLLSHRPQHSGLSIFGKVRSNFILRGRFPQATDKYSGHLREYRSDQSCPLTLQLLLFLQALLKWPVPSHAHFSENCRLLEKSCHILHTHRWGRELAIIIQTWRWGGSVQPSSNLGGGVVIFDHSLFYSCLSERRQTRAGVIAQVSQVRKIQKLCKQVLAYETTRAISCQCLPCLHSNLKRECQTCTSPRWNLVQMFTL